MRLPALTAAALTAATLLAGTAPNAFAAQAAGVLNLWAGFNQTGQVKPVPAPEREGCVSLDSSFRTRSAGNRSQHTASLYANEDCSGEPAELVGAGRRPNFAHPISVGSVAFT